MRYVKIKVDSNYLKSKLYISEKQCFKVLELIRLFHEITAHNNENNLTVTMKAVRFKNRPKKRVVEKLKFIGESSIQILENKLQSFKAAA